MDITSEYFEDETYYCRECDKDIKDDQVNKQNWCCDDCGRKLLIDIGIENHTNLVRLIPSEMTKYDNVFDKYYRKFHSLKGINYENGKYKIGVAEFGMLKLDEYEFVNCRWNDQ